MHKTFKTLKINLIPSQRKQINKHPNSLSCDCDYRSSNFAQSILGQSMSFALCPFSYENK